METDEVKTESAPPASEQASVVEDREAEITFKTITQQTFKYTFPVSTTIADVKQKLFEEKGEEFGVDRQKLIYNGKILEDTQTLAEINVEDKKFIVVMCARVCFIHFIPI
jgi:hypothetical protein